MLVEVGTRLTPLCSQILFDGQAQKRFTEVANAYEVAGTFTMIMVVLVTAASGRGLLPVLISVLVR